MSFVFRLFLKTSTLLFLGVTSYIGCFSPGPSLHESNSEKQRYLDGNKHESTQPSEKNITPFVGALCTSNAQCGSELECEKRIPKGYCTRTCLRSTDCPADSVCVRIRFKEGSQFLRCLRTCKTQADCRPSFHCYHPPKAWKLICLPQLSSP